MNDITLENSKLKTFKSLVASPTLRVKMLLPEVEFNNFNFGYVYLNNGDLNGYYIVESIVNYKDSTTLVEVNLIEATSENTISTIPVYNPPSGVAYSLIPNKGSYNLTGRTINFSRQYSTTIFLTKQATTTFTPVKIYYKINTGSWVLLTTWSVPVNSPTYVEVTTKITASIGNTIYIGIQEASGNNNINFGEGSGGTFTGYCGQTTPYSFVLSSSVNKYINLAVSGSAYINC